MAGPLRLRYGMDPGATLTSVQFGELWNMVVNDFSRLVPVVIPAPPGAGDMDFPWKTLATPYSASPVAPLAWRIDVSLATVNDVPPTIIYLAAGDPRGWTPPPVPTPPDGTPAPPANTSPLVERSLAALDRPWLLLTAPKIGATPTTSDQFQPVSDYARPDFFRTADMWEKLLFQSSVFLTDIVNDAATINIPPEYLGRLSTAIRLTAGVLPSIALGSPQGQLELARLFLLRDPNDKTGASDIIMVRQEVYYCVEAELIEPQNTVTGGGYSTDPDNVEAEFEFWTA